MPRKGKTFAQSDKSKTFGNAFTHLDSIPDEIDVPMNFFEKHDVQHVYSDAAPDHGLPQYDNASETEKLEAVDAFNDAISNQKYGTRSSAIPESVPEVQREKVGSVQKSRHAPGHGAIPANPPRFADEFMEMTRAQMVVIQNLPSYAAVVRFRVNGVGSVDELKRLLDSSVALTLREERKEDDCVLLSYCMDDAGRFYVCFAVDAEHGSILKYFYSCDCEIK